MPYCIAPLTYRSAGTPVSRSQTRSAMRFAREAPQPDFVLATASAIREAVSFPSRAWCQASVRCSTLGLQLLHGLRQERRGDAVDRVELRPLEESILRLADFLDQCREVCGLLLRDQRSYVLAVCGNRSVTIVVRLARYARDAQHRIAARV